MWVKIRVFLIVVAVTSGVAQAGEMLFLRTGEVQLPPLPTLGDLSLVSAPGNAVYDSPEEASKYFVVQYRGPIGSESLQLLKGRQIQVVNYLPDEALLVRARRTELQALRGVDVAIRSWAHYSPQWKRSKDFPPGSVFNARDRLLVMVKVFSQQEAQPIRKKIGAMPQVIDMNGDSRIDGDEPTFLVFEMMRRTIERVALIEGIEWIEPHTQISDGLMEGRLPLSVETVGPHRLSGYETGTRVLRLAEAWARGLNGEGQIIGLTDTGLSSGEKLTLHRDLRRLIAARNFIRGAQQWWDQHGHGTILAGLIMGAGRLSQGQIRGAAFKAGLVAQSIWRETAQGKGTMHYPTSLIPLLKHSYQLGARVHNISWGRPSRPGIYDRFSVQIDQAMWRTQDLLVVVAAGNMGVDRNRDGRVDQGSISAPGTAKNALTVGASENFVEFGGWQKTAVQLKNGARRWPVAPLAQDPISDNPNGLAVFSGRGPTRDGRVKPDVVAPGTNLLSTRSHRPRTGSFWGIFNEHYIYSGGTSMATALVSGAAAVARQFFQRVHKIEKPSAALVKAALIHSARDLYPGQFGEGGLERGQEILKRRPGYGQGYGRVDMARLIGIRGPNVLIVDERGGIEHEKVKEIRFRLERPAKIVATLVFTDAPAALSAAKTLVNDLDLAVIDIERRKVNTLNDHRNTVEMIETGVLAPGRYKVVVKGTRVVMSPTGRQPFALILSRHYQR